MRVRALCVFLVSIGWSLAKSGCLRSRGAHLYRVVRAALACPTPNTRFQIEEVYLVVDGEGVAE